VRGDSAVSQNYKSYGSTKRALASPAVLVVLALPLLCALAARGAQNPASTDSSAAAPVAGGRAAPCKPPSPNRSFAEGEWFQFSIQYGAVRAGDALMQVESVENFGGRPCYRLVSKAESNSFFSLFYKVRDRIDSFMDVQELVSRRFSKNTLEGKHKDSFTIDLDPVSGKARYSDGSEIDFPACSQDILSAFYFVRTLDLKVGQSVEVQCHADKKNYPLVVKVHRREKMRTPAGQFTCLVVEPLLKTSGIFRQKGKLTIWLTDDEFKIPVLMKSKIIVGSVSAVLTDMYSPTAGEKYARAQKK
jgi:Protein of unknown function (DUF3108)